jgi:hypothetical protein
VHNRLVRLQLQIIAIPYYLLGSLHAWLEFYDLFQAIYLSARKTSTLLTPRMTHFLELLYLWHFQDLATTYSFTNRYTYILLILYYHLCEKKMKWRKNVLDFWYGLLWFHGECFWRPFILLFMKVYQYTSFGTSDCSCIVGTEMRCLARIVLCSVTDLVLLAPSWTSSGVEKWWRVLFG